MKIRTRLVLLSAAIMVPIVVLATINTFSLWQVQRETHQQRYLERVSALRLALDTELTATLQTLRFLSDAPMFDEPRQLPSLAARFDQLLQRYSSWTAVAYRDAEGDVLARAPAGADAADFVLDGATAARIEATRAGAVSDLVLLKNGVLTTYVAVPVVRAGKLRGILYIAISSDSWLQFLRRYPVGESATLTLNDSGGLIIARTLNSERWAGKRSSTSYRDSISGRTEGTFVNNGLEGQRFYTAFSRLHNSSWTLGSGVPEGVVNAALRNATWGAVGGLVLAIGIAFVFAHVFSRRIAAALDALAVRARAFATGERLQPLAPLPVAEAETARQALFSGLEQLQARERSLAAALEREGRARADAEHASRLKDQFLAMLSHELRNPMSGISAAAAMLRIEPHSAQTDERARVVIERQTRRLAQIVDDLMDMARLNLDKVVLDRQQTDAAKLVGQVVELFRDSGRCGHLRLVADLDPVSVFADETRLEQVVSNLLDNACKYTPAGGHVRITLRADAGDAVLVVADDGAGIGPDLLPRVFDLFTQGDRTLDRAQGGLGLGLPVVRRLVEMHGGTIVVESAGAGRGASFTVRLPIAAESVAATSEPAPSAGRGSLAVVVVEDAADNREALAILLELQGHRVAVAVDGPSGVDAILGGPCDVAIVDLGLPGFDGHEVARRVRAAGAAAVLIALTGYGTAEDRTQARAAGFDEFFVKPFDPDEFERVLARASLALSQRPAGAPPPHPNFQGSPP